MTIGAIVSFPSYQTFSKYREFTISEVIIFHPQSQFGTNPNKLAAELTYQAHLLQSAVQLQQQQQQNQGHSHTQATPTGPPPPAPPAAFNPLPFGTQGLSIPPMQQPPPSQLTIPQSGKGGTSFNTQQISPNNTATAPVCKIEHYWKKRISSCTIPIT